MNIKNTKCWDCSKDYNIEYNFCPHCKASNANVDFDQAWAEAGEKIKNSQNNPYFKVN